MQPNNTNLENMEPFKNIIIKHNLNLILILTPFACTYVKKYTPNLIDTLFGGL